MGVYVALQPAAKLDVVFGGRPQHGSDLGVGALPVARERRRHEGRRHAIEFGLRDRVGRAVLLQDVAVLGFHLGHEALDFGPADAASVDYPDYASKVGAAIAHGGDVLDLGLGQYMAPTIIAGVKADMAVAREEVFGPLLTIEAFDDIDHAMGRFAATGVLVGAPVALRIEDVAANVRRPEHAQMLCQREIEPKEMRGLRGITNSSSGKMGFAVARAAREAGAAVTLVAGPVQLPTPRGVAPTIGRRKSGDPAMSDAGSAPSRTKHCGP